MIDTAEIRARHRRIHKFAGDSIINAYAYVECECGVIEMNGLPCDAIQACDEIDRLTAAVLAVLRDGQSSWSTFSDVNVPGPMMTVSDDIARAIGVNRLTGEATR